LRKSPLKRRPARRSDGLPALAMTSPKDASCVDSCLSRFEITSIAWAEPATTFVASKR
jgi:hypothetical protein